MIKSIKKYYITLKNFDPIITDQANLKSNKPGEIQKHPGFNIPEYFLKI